jgi:phage baseplate assembly protein W
MANLRDFYLRTEDDPQFENDRIEISDDLESAIQQIKMTLFTNKGEVLGEPDFGVDIDKYLFDYSLDPDAIASEATIQINKYAGEVKKRKITVTPTIYADSVSNRDIFVLMVNLPEQKDPIAVFYD